MHLFFNWIFKKCYSWNSGPGGLDFRVNFQCAGFPSMKNDVPLNALSHLLQSRVSCGAGHPLPGNWGAPHHLSPWAAPGKAALGQMVFSPWGITQPCFSLCHPSAPPPQADKPWENQPRWSCTNPVQLWFDPDPPAQLWMENKEVIDVLHVSLLLILLCKPPDTHLYLLGLPALLLRCTTVFFFHSWLLWIIFVLSWAFGFFSLLFLFQPLSPSFISPFFLVLWGMVFIF